MDLCESKKFVSVEIWNSIGFYEDFAEENKREIYWVDGCLTVFRELQICISSENDNRENSSRVKEISNTVGLNSIQSEPSDKLRYVKWS